MKKASSDSKVKKTLVRNYEQKVLKDRNVVNVEAGPSKLDKNITKSCKQKQNKFDQPTLCSSEVLASYLTNIRNREPSPVSTEDLNVNKAQLSAKITKKLNFHFNDRIYKNLVELNTDNANLKPKDKKNSRSKTFIKKDLEPNIEDFCQDEQEPDVCPNIPVIKRKVKLVKRVEDGRLHRLVASFENL